MEEGIGVARSVNVRDVAARAGVSVGTVSNVLNHPEKVSPAVTAVVQDAIDALDFVRNGAARQLRAGRSRTVGLVVLDISNPFFTDIARGAEDRAATFGLAVMLGNSDENGTRELNYLNLFEEQRVHGVLISPFGDVFPRLRRLRARGTPAVLVDRIADGSGFSSVSVDDVAGGRLAVKHLIAQGRRRIAYVGGPTAISQVTDRWQGAQRAAADNPEVSLEMITTRALSVIEGQRAGERILRRSQAKRPDAIFGANDLIALGLMQALSMSGTTTVPDDIAIIGYDDIGFAATAIVPLSSIRQPSFLIGQTAMDLLMEEAADPGRPARQVVFQPELVVRTSAG